MIAAGRVPAGATPFLLVGRGVAIPKNEAGDLRPIVVGHVLLRLIGSLSIEKLKGAVLRYFLAESLQFGASTADGCSIVATAIEAFLEKHPGTIDIASDAKNAFNFTVDRGSGLLWTSISRPCPASFVSSMERPLTS